MSSPPPGNLTFETFIKACSVYSLRHSTYLQIEIIITAAAIAAILCSVFGIFWSNEAVEGMPMTQAIVEVNSDFTSELQRQLDELSAGRYDAVVVSYDGDYDGGSEMVNVIKI